MERLKELFVLFAFMVAIILFPWISFLMIRLFATTIELDPASTVGVMLSVVPNLIIFIIAIVFLKMDDWDFKALGLNLKRIFPGFCFAVLVLIGLYVLVPYIMTIFMEPRTLVVSFDQGVKDAFATSGGNFWQAMKQPASQSYFISFLRSWLIVGVCEEFSSRGYMLNKFYSILPEKMNKIGKKIGAVLFVALFFTLLRLILTKASGAVTPIAMDKLAVIFGYGVLVSYLYLKTNNIYVAIFMQAAFDFSPLGLTVNKVFNLTDPGFIVSMVCLFIFIIVLAETYSYWGKPLEFNRKPKNNPTD
jgi:membrane protease YdiL (CAAX protease family)